MKMRMRSFLMLVVAAGFGVACGGPTEPTAILGGGGGAGGGGGGGSSTLSATFTPATGSPGSNSASLVEESGAGDILTLAVNANDVSGLASASFTVGYDPAKLQFMTPHAEGDVFPPGGSITVVQSSVPGEIVVGVSAVPAVPVDITGSSALIRLTFRSIEAGSSALTFENAALLDGSVQDLPGVAWFGGTVSAN